MYNKFRSRILNYVLDEKDIESIIWYGNKSGKDVDLFVILNKQHDYFCEKDGRLDIIVIGEECLLKMLKKLEPIATEPILTGSVIFGKDGINEYREFVESIETNQTIVKHLFQLACTFYKWAVDWWKKGVYRNTINNLEFVASYAYFSRYYKAHKRVVTYKELRETLNEFELNTIKLFDKDNYNITSEEMRHKFCLIEDLLTNTRVIIE